jgi:glycosyltransferase involved in cell wall biosynthesis
VSAVPEIVADGESGILVAPGDVAAVSAGLSSLLAAPARAEALGHAGLERARALFSVARMTDATAAVYDRAVED